jgi:hypothetical protein
MSRKTPNRGAIAGVSDHAGWAAVVTAMPDGTVLDRRRLELLDAGLPPMPHHHDAHSMPLEDAIELIERVRASAHRHAKSGLETVASALAWPIHGVALRACPRLPPTTAERIRNYWAQNRADWVMYREALAEAAKDLGWSVHWYDAKTVLDAASDVLPTGDLEERFVEAKKSLGAPWGRDQKIAMAAAISAAARERAGRS